MSENLKKLTGKNPKDFEPLAYALINTPDVELFAELVGSDDFLFDFVKQNVANRLSKVCNESNYMNLLALLKYYSPFYEDFIVSNLVKFANEDLTDKLLEIFENGTDEEKTYCAKFFAFVQDPLALQYLQQNAYSENSALSSNCASTLALLGDKTSYNQALEKLNSDDEFTILDGVKFLVSYGDKAVVPEVISAMKKSSMAENIAGELLYLTNLFELYKQNQEDGLFVLNSIINGLGEILGLAQIFDFRLYEFLEMLINGHKDSKVAVVLINAVDKFDTLTENDEYLFDETKDTKQEVNDIKKLLSTMNIGELYALVDEELEDGSLFVFSALEFTEDENKVRSLLSSVNPTIVLKALEVLKILGVLTNDDKHKALDSVVDENLRSVIYAI